MPGTSGFQAAVAAGSEAAYTAQCLQGFQSFQNLRQLDMSFADSQELSTADIAQLAGLKGLTCLRLNNVSLPAGVDCSPLTALHALEELSLIHHSKVSALMVGDSHLQVRSNVRANRVATSCDCSIYSVQGGNSAAI